MVVQMVAKMSSEWQHIEPRRIPGAPVGFVPIRSNDADAKIAAKRQATREEFRCAQ